MERLNEELSRKKLAKSLNKFFKTTYYTERKIGLIESNEPYLKFDVVDEMCCFFNLTIQDLLCKKWSEYNQDFTDYFQNKITKHCHLPDENRTRIHQFSQLISHFNLVNKQDWVSFPKYDFIQRIYYDYFEKNIIDYSTCEIALNTFELHYPNYLYKNNSDLVIKYDSAGILSVADHREPISDNLLKNGIEKIEHAMGLLLEINNYKYMQGLFTSHNIEKLLEYLKYHKIILNDLSARTLIPLSTLQNLHKDSSKLYFKDIQTLCNYLGFSINEISNYTNDIQDNIDAKNIGEHLGKLANTSEVESFNQLYYLTSQATQLLIPKYCYEAFFRKMKKELNRGSDETILFMEFKLFIFQWHYFNKLKTLLSQKLNGKLGKSMFYTFTKMEIESALGNRLYPNNPVNLLGALTLKRIAECEDRSNKYLQEIMNEQFK
ncbi:helix-turn-helix domain-containing protein (plasmid) [Staphylococcus sp. LKG4-2]|uniref:helix-turn-helix domain-containing protein n=1 Tax=Staphylococcus sp. LKG4-2 TaxID=3399686 RepID=UPI003D989B76